MSDYREFQDGEVVPGTRYRVARLIGTGGMGRVYEVEHIELGKRFVLKALLRELSRREDLVARLRNEWRALARLEHPNIVNVTDAGTSENGVPFYVMERLEGETLSELLHRQRRLHPQHALAIAASILEGLHAAHQIGVVHRDVKPPNVFLTASGVKVLDFGIAKIKDAKGVITARGIAVGTPRYMSPEQAQGAAVDARSDIYATGLMLFEMLSGVGPFDDAKDHNELLLAHLGRKAPLLSSICVVAPELDAVVAGLLAKDPRERPGSARQVAEVLRQLAGRYAHFVATDAPTIKATPRPASRSEPLTRGEGLRRAALSSPTLTRPDGPLALGRASTEPQAPQSESEVTAQQPALEVATTAAQALPVPLPSAGHTQRLAPASAPPASPSFYGPDTLIDPLTKAPTAAPEAAPERTEILLLARDAEDARAPQDESATRTAVPLLDAPNLTPPPVVPARSLPPPRSARRGSLLLGGAVIVGGALLLSAGVWFLRVRPPVSLPVAAAPDRPMPKAGAGTAPSAVPVWSEPESAEVPAAEAGVSSAASLPSALPPARLEKGAPSRAASEARIKRPLSASESGMPGSGL